MARISMLQCYIIVTLDSSALLDLGPVHFTQWEKNHFLKLKFAELNAERKGSWCMNIRVKSYYVFNLKG